MSFHVGSQCTDAQNYVQALHLAAGIFAEAKLRGFDLNLLDIGGGFPAHYDDTVPAFRKPVGSQSRWGQSQWGRQSRWGQTAAKPVGSKAGGVTKPVGSKAGGVRASFKLT